MTNKVEPKSLAELEAMHTGSLMSRRKALLKCDESCALPDARESARTGMIQYKNTPEWKRAYSELKAVLSTRENIPNKKQRKQMRQARAKSKS